MNGLCMLRKSTRRENALETERSTGARMGKSLMRKMTGLAIGAALLSVTALQPAFAQDYYGYRAPYYGYSHYDRGFYERQAQYRYGYGYNPYGYSYNPYGTPPAIRCEQKRQTNTAGGAILGALVGGLLGNSASHGDRGAGTAIGAIAGGVLGASIGNAASCQNHYYR